MSAMSERRAVDVECPKCGAKAQAYPGQIISHARCPKKGSREAPPIYRALRT